MSDRSEPRSPRDILDAWRSVETQLSELDEGTSEWHRARLAAEELAREYQRVVAERQDEAEDLAATVPSRPDSGMDVRRDRPATRER